MTLRDYLIAAVRTSVQAAAGWIVAQLAGIDILVDQAALETVLLGLTTGAVVLILRAAESRWPWIARVTSLGFRTSGPTY